MTDGCESGKPPLYRTERLEDPRLISVMRSHEGGAVGVESDG